MLTCIYFTRKHNSNISFTYEILHLNILSPLNPRTMKYFIFSFLLSIGFLQVDNQLTQTTSHYQSKQNSETGNFINLQDPPEIGRMSAIAFKSQEFCRAELKDFDFDVQFKIVSATVYFSGAFFKDVAVGHIKSNSLLPISQFMQRCGPGTIVSFEDVKVVGPDKLIRNIPGITLRLY